jgi:PAS domain S-box-containing protein
MDRQTSAPRAAGGDRRPASDGAPESRKASPALIENESFHRFAAEAGRTGSWYLRLDSDEFVLSPMAAQLFGLPGQRTLWPAGGWDRSVVPEDREGLRAAIRAAAQIGESFEMEVRIRREDGAERWLYVRGGAAEGPAGERLRVHGAAVDMTERKLAEARRLAMIELADRLRGLADPVEILSESVAVIGRTVAAAWAAFGTLDSVDGLVAIEQSWAAPGFVAPQTSRPFADCPAYRDFLSRGEPVVVAGAALGRDAVPLAEMAGPSSVVYRPLSVGGGPHWLLHVHSERAHLWSPDELAFIREAVERTRDAVEQHRAEQDLRNLTQWLEREVETRTAEWSRLWRNSRDLLLVMDRTGVVRAANPAWRAILDRAPDTVAGRSIADFVHPDDVTATLAALGVDGEAKALSFESRFQRPDGESRWISWVAAPEDDLIYATGRHITAEREAADALEDSQTRLRNFFETSYQHRALVSLDGVLLEANATALAAAGVGREDVVGKPLWRTPWFTRTPGVPKAVRAATLRVAGGEVRHEDIQLNLPALGWRWLDFTLRPLHDSRGVAVAIVLEAVDITEQRRTEAALRQSQKLEAMGQLTGGVAHDFNNLLTPIIGGLDMVQRRGLGGERDRRLIDGALQSAERARTLVQRLLAFARRQPLQSGPVDVRVLIAGMADLVASTSGPRVEVSIETPPDLPHAQADANQLELAILNLSVNARDAMPQGGALKISAAAERIASGHRSALPAGEFIRLSVADTGTGMDEATLGRAIEPFFSTKGRGRGTGLGLSMAHGLASQLGGALLISSAPGQGSTVDLWLPVSTERAGAARSVDAAPAESGPAGVALLVDDERHARLSTAHMLAELNYEVLEAASGEDAVRLLEAGRSVDLLVTDQLMPGMSGVELAQAFRLRRPGAPVLIISGYADAIPSDMTRLGKPFRIADLAVSIASLTAGA